MKKLHVELENCYGIKKFEADFNFEDGGNVYAVYAPNGVMKTSFANTFRDLSQGAASSDRIWGTRPCKRTIVDESGKELPKETVFVIEPYNQAYRSDKISTLLVNEGLRNRYDAIHKGINEKADELVRQLKPLAGMKDGIREELANSITHDPKDFYIALVRVKEEVKDGSDGPLGDVVYSDVFNPKVAALLGDPSFREKIKTYIEKYDELVSKSTFFKKGVFTHNNAADIAKNLRPSSKEPSMTLERSPYPAQRKLS